MPFSAGHFRPLQRGGSKSDIGQVSAWNVEPLEPWYLSGLFDGEGSFGIYVRDASYGLKLNISAALTLREDQRKTAPWIVDMMRIHGAQLQDLKKFNKEGEAPCRSHYESLIACRPGLDPSRSIPHSNGGTFRPEPTDTSAGLQLTLL